MEFGIVYPIDMIDPPGKEEFGKCFKVCLMVGSDFLDHFPGNIQELVVGVGLPARIKIVFF